MSVATQCIRCLFVVLLALAAISTCDKARAQSGSSSPCATKMAALLPASGYEYKTHRADVWSIAFNREHLKDFKVVLSTNEDLLVVFVTVVKKSQMPVAAEFRGTLLSLNHKLDRVKVGLDDDGDLFVRSDCTCRILDSEEFKEQVKQVAASADDVYGKISSSISPR
jgi:putative sensory transduction regulator